MVDLLAALTSTPASSARSDWFGPFSFNDWTHFSYPVQTLRGDREEITGNFEGYVQGAYQSNGIVFTLELIRMMIFAEARVMYRRLNKGRSGELFYTPTLNMLRRPSPGQTQGDLMSRALLDADMAGNHFALRRNGRIKRLRPDWMTIVLGSESDYDLDPAVDPEAEIVGYLYHPGGYSTSQNPVPFLASEVAHWAPVADPLAQFRGMSWLTPVVREIQADRQATSHKQAFYENGATPNMIIKHQIADVETMQKWIALFKDTHEGSGNAYKTLHLGAGADATVVGKDFQQLDFKAVQGAGETRIAAASLVGSVLAGFSEGLQGSSLNTGNFGANRRKVADMAFRPLWRGFFGSYEQIIPIPRNAELWYDEPDISFLREDEKDAADIQFRRSQTVRNLLDAGYVAESVKAAVENDDFKLLDHSGLFSVQLQRPGTPTAGAPAPDPEGDEPDE